MAYDLLQQQVPTALSRERRIELLVAARDALVAGAPIPADAARFLGQALDRWLTDGGDLERDHLEIRGQPGSHHTPAFLAQRLQARLQANLGDEDDRSSRGAQGGADRATREQEKNPTVCDGM